MGPYFYQTLQHICPWIQRGLYKGLTTRAKRVAAKSIAAIPAESIPFIVVAVLIADTGYELYAACETVRDLDQLYSDLGMAEEAPDDAVHSVCDPELPEAGEVWDAGAKVVDKNGESYSITPSLGQRQTWKTSCVNISAITTSAGLILVRM
jgi:hypothetical protein